MLTLVFLASVVPASAFVSWVWRRCVWKNAICTSLGGKKTGKHKQDQIYMAAAASRKILKKGLGFFKTLRLFYGVL